MDENYFRERSIAMNKDTVMAAFVSPDSPYEITLVATAIAEDLVNIGRRIAYLSFKPLSIAKDIYLCDEDDLDFAKELRRFLYYMENGKYISAKDLMISKKGIDFFFIHDYERIVGDVDKNVPLEVMRGLCSGEEYDAIILDVGDNITEDIKAVMEQCHKVFRGTRYPEVEIDTYKADVVEIQFVDDHGEIVTDVSNNYWADSICDVKINRDCKGNFIVNKTVAFKNDIEYIAKRAMKGLYDDREGKHS